MNDILILGGSGKTGRRVAHRLRDAGHAVRTASRTHGDVPLDLDDPSTWPRALDGIAAAYLVEPALQTTDEGRRRIARFVAEAVAAGVRRLVLLSAPGGDKEDHPLWHAEEAVKTSGREWTIVQPGWFAQNFSEDFWRPGILDGTLTLPTGDGATAFVDAGDIADVAAAALLEDGHHGETYLLSGPRAITFAEAADLIGAAVGREIRYVAVDPAEYVRGQVAAGVPVALAERFVHIYAGIRDGEAAEIWDGVPRALGRPPRTFEDFVTAAAASGAWDLTREPRPAG
jgi:uncharacterized protein YbjT (DUF2867 family)